MFVNKKEWKAQAGSDYSEQLTDPIDKAAFLGIRSVLNSKGIAEHEEHPVQYPNPNKSLHSFAFKNVVAPVEYKRFLDIRKQNCRLVKHIEVVPTNVMAQSATPTLDIVVTMEYNSTPEEHKLPLPDISHPDSLYIDTMDTLLGIQGSATAQNNIRPFDADFEISCEDQAIVNVISHLVHHMSERMPLVTTRIEDARGTHVLLYFRGLHAVNERFLSAMAYHTANFIESMVVKTVDLESALPPFNALELCMRVRKCGTTPRYVYTLSSSVPQPVAQLTLDKDNAYKITSNVADLPYLNKRPRDVVRDPTSLSSLSAVMESRRAHFTSDDVQTDAEGAFSMDVQKRRSSARLF